MRILMPETSTSDSWFPLITACAGYLAGFVTVWFRDQRASKRDSEAVEATSTRDRVAKEAATRDQLFQRLTEYQRLTLLALQEAVMKLVRTTGEMHHQDEMTHRAKGQWGKQLFGTDLENRAHLATVETTVLGARVHDETVRTLLAELKDESIAVALSEHRAHSNHAMRNVLSGFVKLNERIGELLRKLDDGADVARLGS